MTTNTAAPPQIYNSKVLDHLGLVSGMFDELGLGELIDQLIPQDHKKRNVSVGQAVKAMVLNGLGFMNRALYLTPKFFKDKPVDRLIGEGIEAFHLNDDVLGRALDDIFAYNPTKLYSHLAAQSVSRLGLSCRFGHLDSTSFHVDGQYKIDGPEEEGVVQLVKGYSRDHRPDINQLVMQLINERQAGIPILMEALSGNSSDKEGFHQTIKQHISQLQDNLGLEYLVADSALYTAKTLKALRNIFWISRVPATLNLAKEIIRTVAPNLMRDLDQKTFCSLSTEYADIRQRWVIIFSPEAYQRALKSVNKKVFKRSTDELKSLEKLCKNDFACEADAHKALTAFTKKLKMISVENIRITSRPCYKKKGRPAQGRKPDFYLYRIAGEAATLLEERSKLLEQKSCFILATNQLDCQQLSAEELMAVYKDQQKVERGFRFLKDPLFMASTLFLESSRRIMALSMIMTICLLIYAALEHRIRGTLQQNNETFPDQKGKPNSRPTTRWVFQFFAGIHVLNVDFMQQIVLNMNEHQARLLRLLGPRYERLYSGSG